jgi:aerobic-type carbon monoxide dehydrogenase small subunit (CoxS/CutS family)
VSQESPPPRPDWSRREFIKGTTTLVSTLPLAGVLAGCGDPQPDAPIEPLERIDPEALPAPASLVNITLSINGTVYPLQVEPRLTLNAAIRDVIGLTGTKLGCDRAACGACTVHLDGTPVLSCTTLAVEADGRSILTIEGLATGDELHPIQEAFIEQDALQCGFCTPGMVMACKALLDHNLNPTEDDVRRATAGNLCRCGTYPHVFQAALQAAETMRGG